MWHRKSLRPEPLRFTRTLILSKKRWIWLDSASFWELIKVLFAADFLVLDYSITTNTLFDLGGSKKKAASKLNKEFDLYEVLISLVVDSVRFALRELNFSNKRYN